MGMLPVVAARVEVARGGAGGSGVELGGWLGGGQWVGGWRLKRGVEQGLCWQSFFPI